MTHLLSKVAAHVTRVAIAAIAVGALWVAVSFTLSLALKLLDVATPATLVVVAAISYFTAFIGAGYLSARYIAVGSLLHAAAAGFIAMFAWTVVASHGPWYYGIFFWAASAGLCSGGAQIANRTNRSSLIE